MNDLTGICIKGLSDSRTKTFSTNTLLKNQTVQDGKQLRTEVGLHLHMCRAHGHNHVVKAGDGAGAEWRKVKGQKGDICTTANN